MTKLSDKTKKLTDLPEYQLEKKLNSYIEKHNMRLELDLLSYSHMIMGPLVFFFCIDQVFFNQLTHHSLIYIAYVINKLASIFFVLGLKNHRE